MNFLFYYPSRKIGGSEILFARLSLALSQLGHIIFVVDYKNGFVSNFLNTQKSSYTHIECDDSETAIVPRNVEVIVVYPWHFTTLSKLKVPPTCRLLIWEVHKSFWNFGFPQKTLKSQIYSLLMKSICQKLVFDRGLLVLEQDSLDLAKSIGIKHLDRIGIVPIPVNNSQYARIRVLSQDKLRFVSIGRAVEDKIIPAIWAFNLITINFSNAVFSFITDDVISAKAIWERLDPTSFGNVVFLPEKQNEILDQYLNEQADIVIAMGTSVLEAGKLGIPAIILDVGTWPYPADAKVRLLCENKNCNLGSTTPTNLVGYDICHLIDMIIANYSEYSRKTLDYVQSTHNIETCSKCFVVAAKETSLYYNKFNKILAFKLVRFFIRLNLLLHKHTK